MTDLRALLGDRHDQVMQAACGCNGTRLLSGWLGNWLRNKA